MHPKAAMFARRKRHPEDEEPLVPHGLISQAMEPAPPEGEDPKLSKPPQSTKINSAARVERPVQPAPPEGEDSDGSKPLQKIAANPVHSVEPVQPQKIAATPAPPPLEVKPIQATPLQPVEHTPTKAIQPVSVAERSPKVPETPSSIAQAPHRVPKHFQISEYWNRIRPFGAARLKEVSEAFRSSRTEFLAAIRKLRSSVNLSARTSAAASRSRELISESVMKAGELRRAWTTKAAQKTQPRLEKPASDTHIPEKRLAAVRSSGIVAKLPAQFSATAVRFRQFTLARGARAVELCRSWKIKAANHFRAAQSTRNKPEPVIWNAQIADERPDAGPKLRIRLEGLPLKIRIWFARAKLEWQLRREAMARDSRLWTSMALGGLAAVLVMSVFAVARHYAQASLPSSHVVKASEQQDATPASTSEVTARPINLASEKTTRSVSAKKTIATRNPVNANAAPAKPKPHATAGKRRAHHNPDEDYVAADTYVYYGNRRSK